MYLKCLNHIILKVKVYLWYKLNRTITKNLWTNLHTFKRKLKIHYCGLYWLNLTPKRIGLWVLFDWTWFWFFFLLFDWFCTKRNSVWCRISRMVVETIWIGFSLTGLWRWSLCVYLFYFNFYFQVIIIIIIYFFFSQVLSSILKEMCSCVWSILVMWNSMCLCIVCLL